MSFPIMMNINNQVSQHQYKYTFSRPIDLSKFEIALGSVSMYYSWKAITAARGNNKFRIVWPTGATTQTFNITLPDGTYTASDLNAYLQYFSIQNNLYYINSTTGQYKYFISCAENPSAYALQFTMLPYVAQAGYTAAVGALAVSTSGYTPQLQILDSAFGSIVGLSPATYPAALQTAIYSVSSNLVPTIDPVASVIMDVSNLSNPVANNNQVLHSFTSAGVGFGGLITTSQGQGLAFTPMQGTTNELMVSFYDQNMLPLQIIDANLCSRFLRPKKNDDYIF